MVINYITYDSWWDTDITIIPELVKEYHLNVFVLSPFDNCKYPQKEIGQNVKLVHVHQKYRDRDLRSIGTAIKYFFKIYKECRRKDYINIFYSGKESVLYYSDSSFSFQEKNNNMFSQLHRTW